MVRLVSWMISLIHFPLYHRSLIALFYSLGKQLLVPLYSNTFDPASLQSPIAYFSHFIRGFSKLKPAFSGVYYEKTPRQGKIALPFPYSIFSYIFSNKEPAELEIGSTGLHKCKKENL